MGRIIPYIMENQIHVPNHQPVFQMFFGPCPGPCSLKHPVLHLLGALAIDSPSTAGCVGVAGWLLKASGDGHVEVPSGND